MLTVLLVISAIAACAKGAAKIPEDMKEMAQALRDNCIEETGVDPSLLGPCENGNFADDPKLKCYFKCVFGQMGAITEDDELDADAFESILPPELSVLGKSIMACKDTKGSDGCDMAMKFNQCIYGKDPANFLVI
ncbi:general odorant-binding protein 56d-like [Cimex lectularius]|uniref:Odorant binding protein n=1 Tax=Cimex lectularius TaxID=79782 RepID=A0A8I6S4K8_CIMLE|nr:general odorant-binding protein 56d-like [Cimex lectularius]